MKLWSSFGDSGTQGTRPQESDQNIVVVDEAADQEPSPYCSNRLINATLNWEKIRGKLLDASIANEALPEAEICAECEEPVPPSDADIVEHISTFAFRAQSVCILKGINSMCLRNGK